MSKKNLANKYYKLFAEEKCVWFSLRIYNISYLLVSADVLCITEEGGGMEG